MSDRPGDRVGCDRNPAGNGEKAEFWGAMSHGPLSITFWDWRVANLWGGGKIMCWNSIDGGELSQLLAGGNKSQKILSS